MTGQPVLRVGEFYAEEDRTRDAEQQAFGREVVWRLYSDTEGYLRLDVRVEFPRLGTPYIAYTGTHILDPDLARLLADVLHRAADELEREGGAS